MAGDGVLCMGWRVAVMIAWRGPRVDRGWIGAQIKELKSRNSIQGTQFKELKSRNSNQGAQIKELKSMKVGRELCRRWEMGAVMMLLEAMVDELDGCFRGLSRSPLMIGDGRICDVVVGTLRWLSGYGGMG